MLNIRPASRWKRRGEFLVRTWSICLSMQGSSTSAEGRAAHLRKGPESRPRALWLQDRCRKPEACRSVIRVRFLFLLEHRACFLTTELSARPNIANRATPDTASHLDIVPT